MKTFPSIQHGSHSRLNLAIRPGAYVATIRESGRVHALHNVISLTHRVEAEHRTRCVDFGAQRTVRVDTGRAFSPLNDTAHACGSARATARKEEA